MKYDHVCERDCHKVNGCPMNPLDPDISGSVLSKLCVPYVQPLVISVHTVNIRMFSLKAYGKIHG